ATHPVITNNQAGFSDAVLAKISEIITESLKPKERDDVIEKDGIDTGIRAINPFSGEEVPVWVGNYVMMDYGTGAVMSVPGHDERDNEFAQKFDLPIKAVIVPELGVAPKDQTDCYTDYGFLINSGDWTGRSTAEAKKEMSAFAESNGF